MTVEPNEPTDPLISTLCGLARAEYGEAYRGHVLEIYQTYVEMADRISERRVKTNGFFLAVNTAIVALLAKDALGGAGHSSALEVLVPIAGAVVCYLWYRILRSYRDLNSAKFKVVHAIERQLPLRPFDAEWEAVGRGRNRSLYLPFTHVEIVVPWIFIAFHLLLVGVRLPWTRIAMWFGGAG